MTSKTGKLNDTMALILTALACSGVMVLIIAFVRPRFSKEWANFIYTCTSYLALLFYIVNRQPFKRLPKYKIYLFQIIFYVLTTGIAFTVFRFGMLPMPIRLGEYMLPMIALSILSMVVLQYLTPRLKFFNNNDRKYRKKYKL